MQQTRCFITEVITTLFKHFTNYTHPRNSTKNVFFFAVLYARAFVSTSHCHPSLIFDSWARSQPFDWTRVRVSIQVGSSFAQKY